MKQNIYYYWFINNDFFDYSKKDEVVKFCKKYGFISKWQKSLSKNTWGKGYWSIGIFEFDKSLENEEYIINLGRQYFCNPKEKITKSRNDVQLRNHLKGYFILQLKEVEKALKKEKGKINKEITFEIEDLINEEIYVKFEKYYRYQLSSIEKEKVEKEVWNYINKKLFLRDFFKSKRVEK